MDLKEEDFARAKKELKAQLEKEHQKIDILKKELLECEKIYTAWRGSSGEYNRRTMQNIDNEMKIVMKSINSIKSIII